MTRVWIAVVLVSILVVFAMWFGGWFAQFRLLRKDRLGWRIRLGSRLACWTPLQNIGFRLMASGIAKQTPNLSVMERNVLVRQAKTDVMRDL